MTNTTAPAAVPAMTDEQMDALVHDLRDYEMETFTEAADLIDRLRRALSARDAELARVREQALEEAAKCCREEMSRARNLAAKLAGESTKFGDAELVTIGREDSASRILKAIRALTPLPAPTEGGKL